MEKEKRKLEMEMAKKEFDRLLRDVEKKETLPLPDEFMKLFKTGLEAGGFDFSSKESIDKMLNGYLQPLMDEITDEKNKLVKRARDIFAAAGATEKQLQDGDFDHIYITREQDAELNTIFRKLDGLQEKTYYVMGMACTMNEAKDSLK